MKNFIDVKSLKTNRFEMKAESTTKAEIILYGEIGDSWYDEAAVSAKQFSDTLNSLPSTVNEIHLRINSPGGSVFDGMTIYERLKQHKAKVIVYIDGLAASIASVIALAGDEIHIGEGAYMMIHRPWTYSAGNSSEFERVINLLEKLEASMIKIYAKKTGLSYEDIERKLQEDYWMDSDEAVDLGFATDKVEASNSLHIAASFLAKDKRFKNKPTIDASNKLVKTSLDEFSKEMEDFQARAKT